ncbi:MAG: hypothetical protein U9M98_01845 [Patescibacteria group bacterium]|nr:hypothetical protein [Patescibacteria group bacterium]
MAVSDLTERQQKLLSAVVQEYIREAEPVGSKTLVDRYDLDISPATVRNEMVCLIEEGLLEKPHASAGRTPTTMGYRLYISELLEEEELPVIEEVSIKQRLWPERFKKHTLFQEAVRALADSAKLLAMIKVRDSFYHAGAVNILDHPEFFDIDVTRTVLHLLDKKELISELFSKVVADQGVNTLIGTELDLDSLQSCGMVFSRFQTGGEQGTVGVLGPSRMQYSKIFPRVRYMSTLLEEFGGNW